MWVCCLEKNRNIILFDDEENYFLLEKGNIIILYDVIGVYEKNYMVMVCFWKL